jgi:3alpha(or 20beta)-hydroxysteroid dehydrogenase
MSEHRSEERARSGTNSDERLREEPKSMSVYDLTGRKALVTGGAQGLGAGMAQALAAAGASVVIGDLQDDAGQAAAAAITSSGATAGFVHLDVTDDASWEAAVAATIDQLGGLDILVNNAGLEISSLIIDLDPAGVRKMLEVNLLGTLLGVKHAFRAMKPDGAAGRGGAVINVASVAATIAFPGIAGYSATKSGVDRLTRVAARESGALGYGVRVNCIYPGLVPTEMGQNLAVSHAAMGLSASPEAAAGDVIAATPLGRLGQVDDMADAVVFLASDGAKFITGTGLAVDGGMGM